MSHLIPGHWKMIYENALQSDEHIAGFRMEGPGEISFPMNRMRLESSRIDEEDYTSNVVFWCPVDFPANFAATWEFWPIREPGLAILFFCAKGLHEHDIFDPYLAKRSGEYHQYHHGEMNAYHVSYFRRKYEDERRFHTCNLRKSYGFHLVAQGADPIPDVADAKGPYRILIMKHEGLITFAINDLISFIWEDDGESYGPLLGEGKIGFRQMSPLIAEYANLKVFAQA